MHRDLVTGLIIGVVVGVLCIRVYYIVYTGVYNEWNVMKLILPQVS